MNGHFDGLNSFELPTAQVRSLLNVGLLYIPLLETQNIKHTYV